MKTASSSCPEISFKNFVNEKKAIRMNVEWKEFRRIQLITETVSCSIFEATWNESSVILKLMKAEIAHIPIKQREFECEIDALSRMDNPNIVSAIGFGRNPLPFIVLERLLRGTVGDALYRRKSSAIFRTSFSMLETLDLARSLASAINYLHHEFHENVHVIHRDLKPDNMGWTAEGQFKLFDFGLCTCARRGDMEHETYELTGCTGSIRYMAPEVALWKPYNRSVDVYSFGIIVWEIATGRTPFEGVTMDTFLKDIVENKRCNPVEPHWHKAFSDLLERCWSHDMTQRPDISEVIAELDSLIESEKARVGIWWWLPPSLHSLAAAWNPVQILHTDPFTPLTQCAPA